MKNLIEETHLIKLYGRSLSFYRKKGFDYKYGDIIEVKSSELAPNSRIIVKCICSECQNEFKIPFAQYLCAKGTFCSAKCKAKHTKLIIFEKYGVDNVSKIGAVKNIKKRKSQEKYGVDNISQSNLIKIKKRNTTMKHYGVDNISKSNEIKQKKIKTCRKNYGVDYPSQSKIVLSKYVQTIQTKYGIEFTNISQIAEIMDKKFISGIRSKKYFLPSGKIVKVQGYEAYAIEYLLKEGILEDDIVIGNKNIESIVGKFWFFDMKKQKNHRYFPDIYIKSMNMIYEVKSEYTLNLNIELINLKKESVIKKGFNFEFLVFNDKGIKTN